MGFTIEVWTVHLLSAGLGDTRGFPSTTVNVKFLLAGSTGPPVSVQLGLEGAAGARELGARGRGGGDAIKGLEVRIWQRLDQRIGAL